MILKDFKLLMDMGSVYAWITWGVVAGIYSFLVAVFLEARIAKNYFRQTNRNLIFFSFLANLASAACGVLIIFLGVSPFIYPVRWIGIAFVVTIVVEYICWLLLLKTKSSSLLKILGFCIVGNIASYAVILLTPVVITFVYMLISV